MDRQGSRPAGCFGVWGDADEAVAKTEALALRVIADRLDHGESIPELENLFAVST